MYRRNFSNASSPVDKIGRFRWPWLFGLCALVLLLCLFRTGRRTDPPNPRGARGEAITSSPLTENPKATPGWQPLVARPASRSSLPPEEVVAQKLARFACSRREFVNQRARRLSIAVPPELDRFFDAVESGDWNKIEAIFTQINGGDSSAGHSRERSPEVQQLWPAIIDAYGAAEQVHLWPAQQLLDYGNSVLGALRPGMVYVGGTDNGRWIPELLNDTSDGEQHIVLTQNALADSQYLDYVTEQYGDRLAALTPDDSQRAFAEYIADAQKRFQHDQQLPDEPKQVRPGEDISMVDGKVQVGGQTAVMAINEKLLQTLMQKNPDLSFAIEESFPLKNTYADALPLGPLMELGAADGQNTFTADRATESLDYWRNAAQQLMSDPEAAGSESALRSYSHDTVAAANLLAAHSFTAQAEEAYRLASQLWPENPEAVNGLANLLAVSGRADQGKRLLDGFAQEYPELLKSLDQSSAAWTLRSSKR